MTIRLAAPLALIALSCAGPAFAAADPHAGHTTERAADAPAVADAPEDPNPREDRERKVCRTERTTGSLMPKRVCRTVAQIEADQRAAEQFRDRQSRSGGSGR